MLQEPSFGGFPVQFAAWDVFQDPWRRLDLRFGRLQDRVLGGALPGGEGRALVFVVGVFGGGHQALPVGQPAGEFAALRGQAGDPLAKLRDVLPGGEGELVALFLGGGRGFNGKARISPLRQLLRVIEQVLA